MVDESQPEVIEQEDVVEKTLPVSRVNEIVKREKLEAAEKARQESEAMWAKKMEEMQAQQMQAQRPAEAQSASIGGIQGVDQEAIKQQIMQQLAEEQQKAKQQQEQEAHQQQMQQIADSYFTKMDGGKNLYEDFDDITGKFDPSKSPELVVLASQLENTPDVMYELGKHPQKLANIDILARTQPAVARAELEKLSQSIVQNKQAAESNRSASAPLSRIKASTVGTDTGVMGMGDFKKAPWLRG